MIELCSPEVAVTLDPSHGAEILDLVDRRSGRQLLGKPPFEPAPPRGGDLDEETWTASYRGGWQIVAPNAGNACIVGEERHGFHGRASVDPWDVLKCEPASAVLRWVGHGLEFTRRIAVVGRTVWAELNWTATDGRAPLVAVEHIAFGPELLDPEVEVMADACAHELDEQHEPAHGPAAGVRWPRSRLLDGQIEQAGRWPLASERSRLTALTGFTRGRADVRNTRSGRGVRIDWDCAKLPAAWLWHEVRASAGVWRREAQLIAFEPASVPHSLGLAEAVARRQAFSAVPGEQDGYRLSVTLLNA